MRKKKILRKNNTRESYSIAEWLKSKKLPIREDFSYQELLSFALKEGLKEEWFLNRDFFQCLSKDLRSQTNRSDTLRMLHSFIKLNLDSMESYKYLSYRPLEDFAHAMVGLIERKNYTINKQVGDILNAISQSRFTPHEWKHIIYMYYDLLRYFDDPQISFLIDPQEILDIWLTDSEDQDNSCKICRLCHRKRVCCNYCNNWVGCGYWEFVYEGIEKGAICFHCLVEKEIIEDYNVKDTIKITNGLEKLAETSVELQDLHEAKNNWEVYFTNLCSDCGYECGNVGVRDYEGMNEICCLCLGRDYYNRQDGDNMCYSCIQIFIQRCGSCEDECINVKRGLTECCVCLDKNYDDFCELCKEKSCKECHRKCKRLSSTGVCCLCTTEKRFNQGSWYNLPHEKVDEFLEIFFSLRPCTRCDNRWQDQ